jgi:Ca2+/Na+ antiporter
VESERHLRPSSVAWGALIGGIVAWDLLCENGETLSERVDAGLNNHPVATRLAIGMTALHLMNVLPPQIDLIHQLGRLKR